MRTWVGVVLMTLLVQQVDVEQRIIEYLKDKVVPGEAVVVSNLFNNVFTSPEERKVLDRLYNTFFKIPLFLVQYYKASDQIPTLQEISEQFNLRVPGEADVILRVMQADPRVPDFLERDASTGEITRIDMDTILADPRFGRVLERTIAGWEGKPAPPFSVETYDGQTTDSQMMSGRPHLVYFWFTNCPPCVKTSPLLVELHKEYAPQGFNILAANADRLLELPYDDAQRGEYVEKLGIDFTMAHLNLRMQSDYGGVSVFPTMFFVDGNGLTLKHYVNFQEKSVLEEAIKEVLK